MTPLEGASVGAVDVVMLVLVFIFGVVIGMALLAGRGPR